MVRDFISQQKLLLAIIGGTVVTTLSVISWAEGRFVTSAEAATTSKTLAAQIEQISRKVQSQNELLSTHINRYTLDTITNRIEDIKDKQLAIDQFERVNGADAQAEERKKELARRRAALELKKSCIISENRICN